MRNMEVGPSDVTYKIGDYVRILRDMSYGWQREKGEVVGYDERIRYYEGEVIRLQEDEWLGLGTMNIKPINAKQYAFSQSYPPKYRVFACGVGRRFGYWWDTSRTFVGSILYTCIEIPCGIVAITINHLCRFPAVVALLVLLGILCAVCN